MSVQPEQDGRWPYLGDPQFLDEYDVLGISAKAFDRHLFQTRGKLSEEDQRVAAVTRSPRSSRELRIVARSWGWCEFEVYPATYEFEAIGVAEPGIRPSLDMAGSHHRPGWSDSGLASAAAVGVPGAGAGYVLTASALEWAPLWAGVSAAAVGGLGVAGGAWHLRRSRRLQRRSRLITEQSPNLTPVVTLAVYIGLIRAGIERYEQGMAIESREQRLDPIPLRMRASPADIEDGLHQSMWDLATGESLDDADAVLAEAVAIVDMVDAAIGAAWDLRDRTRVRDHDAPAGPAVDEGPAVFRPTVARLQRLRDHLAEDNESARTAADELGRLNGHDRP